MSWYQEAVVYQIHVRAFFDSNQDGIGDFGGLTQKLDYIRDLGVTAIWLLPFYPSPLRDDGYDIADYRAVHKNYGTLRDFKTFLREAHARGLRVINEMVLNHCSDQSEWFQRARRAPVGDAARDFFVWSDNDQKYKEARIIFKDFESSNWSWDPVAGAYYWHRFYHHQPDLNFEHPAVQREMIKSLDYWLDMGIDGVRLDAVPYLFEREGTSCENLPETHGFLKQLRAHVDSKFGDRMFLAEANQWPEDAVAYFGDGDECHTAFHFPLMPRLFMAVQMEDRFPVIDILEQTPAIPSNCQWFLFLRNHDELTLEMVTDEERDYMYRMYARDPQARLNLGIRRRLAPLLNNDRRKVELLNGLLLSLPGTPVLYYGDEIGMGDNVYLGDRDGVRTPMQWNSDRNAGFSRANPQRLFLPVISDHEYHYEAINVDTQQRNPNSLLWWMKRLISQRQQHKQVFGQGSLEFLHAENAKVLAFLRRLGDETILVAANLSRFAQSVQIDLSSMAGAYPVEMFGQTAFPRIGELPYLLTLGPHALYWFIVQRSPVGPAERLSPVSEGSAAEWDAPVIHVPGKWPLVFESPAVGALESALHQFIIHQDWYENRAKTIQTVQIVERFPLGNAPKSTEVWLVLLGVNYLDGERDSYLLPLSFSALENLPWAGSAGPPAVVAQVETERGRGALYDAFGTEALSLSLFDLIASRRRIRGLVGKVAGQPTPSFRRIWPSRNAPLKSRAIHDGASPTSVSFDEQLLLKVFRRIDEGISPDYELREFLMKTSFENSPALAGSIDVEQPDGELWTLGILQQYLRHMETARETVLNSLGRYFEEVLSLHTDLAPLPGGLSTAALFEQSHSGQRPELVTSSEFLPLIHLLGQRTAEMHAALASAPATHKLAPEPFTSFYQRSLFQRMRSIAVVALRGVADRAQRRPDDSGVADSGVAERQIVGLESTVLSRFSQLTKQRLTATRIPSHGSYHLGNVLFTGKDFMVVNFDGARGKPLSERRIKRSPLRDVAEMLHSISQACASSMNDQQSSGIVPAAQIPLLDTAARNWLSTTSAAFLDAYFTAAADTSFIPAQREDALLLLDLLRLERALEQVRDDLQQQPADLGWACQQVLQILDVSI